jgi:hypothetical protein
MQFPKSGSQVPVVSPALAVQEVLVIPPSSRMKLETATDNLREAQDYSITLHRS